MGFEKEASVFTTFILLDRFCHYIVLHNIIWSLCANQHNNSIVEMLELQNVILAPPPLPQQKKKLN